MSRRIASNSAFDILFRQRVASFHIRNIAVLPNGLAIRKICETVWLLPVWKYDMPPPYLTCPSCKKPNVEGGRYCIHCGAILSPIYCSSCGTKNPDGLEQCMECGSSLPTMSGLRWNPIVTVINPTSAMTEGRRDASMDGIGDRTSVARLRSKLTKKNVQ